MPDQESCACNAAPKLVFPCSGASDVGEIADRAARKMTADGSGRMYCLAGVGGRVSGVMAGTQAAAAILAIDGCPQDCARKALELAGFHNPAHLRLSDIGLQKGDSAVNEERVAQAAAKGAELLGANGGGCCNG